VLQHVFLSLVSYSLWSIFIRKLDSSPQDILIKWLHCVRMLDSFSLLIKKKPNIILASGPNKSLTPFLHYFSSHPSYNKLTFPTHPHSMHGLFIYLQSSLVSSLNPGSSATSSTKPFSSHNKPHSSQYILRPWSFVITKILIWNLYLKFIYASLVSGYWWWYLFD
jgi:hypothetical protein